MATTDKYPMMFTGKDRELFGVWLVRCKRIGIAETMTDAIRAAVKLTGDMTDDQISESGEL